MALTLLLYLFVNLARKESSFMKHLAKHSVRSPIIMSVIMSLAATVCFSSGSAEASILDEINSVLYVENTKELQLFLPKETPPRSRFLAPVLSVPRYSLLAVDVITLSRAIERQKLAPQKANARYLESADSDKHIVSTEGWVCGVRVVDIADEELRNNPLNDRSDLCASLEHFMPATGANGKTSVNMEALESNGEAVKQAYASYHGRGQDDSRIADFVPGEVGDNSLLLALADYLARKQAREKEEAEKGIFYGASTTGRQLMSPIKGCSVGCLHITSEFGMRRHPVMKSVYRLHKGVDIRAAPGTPLVSVADGRILATRMEIDPSTRKFKGYGLYMIVVHPSSRIETLYAHLSKQVARSGQDVNQGQTIALSGSSGLGTGPHLHFETRVLAGSRPTLKDPRIFLSWLFNGKASLLDFLPQPMPPNHVELPSEQGPGHTHGHS
jgi:murein DD-endopeptidase MepM/ murein hydrolase activator NlpD